METILQGIKEGFRVGFDPGRAALKEKDGNMASASERTGVYLQISRRRTGAGASYKCWHVTGGSRIGHPL